MDAAAGANGATGTAVGLFTTRDPFLVERAFGRGRVVLAAVPLDNSWRTNLVRLPDFVRLAHELMYYLAGTRTAERNLVPGLPIVFTPRPDEPPGPVTVVNPDGRSRTVAVTTWPAVIDGTTDPGRVQADHPGRAGGVLRRAERLAGGGADAVRGGRPEAGGGRGRWADVCEFAGRDHREGRRPAGDEGTVVGAADGGGRPAGGGGVVHPPSELASFPRSAWERAGATLRVAGGTRR